MDAIRLETATPDSSEEGFPSELHSPKEREREAKGSLPCLECEGWHRGLLTETSNIGATFDGENSVNAQSP